MESSLGAVGLGRRKVGAGTDLLRRLSPAPPGGAVTSLYVVTPIRLYRDALEEFVARSDRLTAAGSACEVAAACEAVVRLRPDVVLLDAVVEPPVAAIRALAAAAPEARIVVLGLPEGDLDAAVLECIETGAAGYVTRDASLAELTEVAETAARGDMVCSTSVAGALARSVATLAAQQRPAASALLTVREREIAELIAGGLSNKEIAGRLHIELPTVKNHVHRILGKLEVRRRADAAARLQRTSVATGMRGAGD
jgi:two-component system, NarL family, nitrate/nitrite response regulator NarL